MEGVGQRVVTSCIAPLRGGACGCPLPGIDRLAINRGRATGLEAGQHGCDVATRSGRHQAATEITAAVSRQAVDVLQSMLGNWRAVLREMIGFSAGGHREKNLRQRGNHPTVRARRHAGI